MQDKSGTLGGRFWFVIGLKCIGQLQLYNLITIFLMKFLIRLKNGALSAQLI